MNRNTAGGRRQFSTRPARNLFRAGRTLAAASAAIGMAAVLSAPPAAAAVGPMRATLVIAPVDARLCPDFEQQVDLSVLVEMPDEEAQRTAHTYSFRWEGRGDDWSDNREFGPFVDHRARAVPGGIRLISKRCISIYDLNEDPLELDADEIFVKITLLHNASGKEIKSVNSNTVVTYIDRPFGI
jgi:hypothetical protein